MYVLKKYPNASQLGFIDVCLQSQQVKVRLQRMYRDQSTEICLNLLIKVVILAFSTECRPQQTGSLHVQALSV